MAQRPQHLQLVQRRVEADQTVRAEVERGELGGQAAQQHGQAVVVDLVAAETQVEQRHLREVRQCLQAIRAERERAQLAAAAERVRERLEIVADKRELGEVAGAGLGRERAQATVRELEPHGRSGGCSVRLLH